jgi:hypothetical protein
MPPRQNDHSFDLSSGDFSQPVPAFVRLVVTQALLEEAEQIIFSLNEDAATAPPMPTSLDPKAWEAYKKRIAAPDLKFHIAYVAKGAIHELAPVTSHLFPDVVKFLCAYASIPHDAHGPVEGKITTKNPDAILCLRSDDLRQAVVLSKT